MISTKQPTISPSIRASCTCTAPIMLRAGRIVCATCSAPVVVDPSAEGTYTTEPGHWPPGCRSRRSARDRIRAAGGTMTGSGSNVVWTIARDRYHHIHDRKPSVRLVAATTDDDLIADAALAGFRVTRGAQ